MAFPKASLFASVMAASAMVHGWTWPSPALDMIESLRFNQRGAHSVLLAELGDPCGGNNGRPNAADWLRASFHDMGTRNASSGLGGVDASIRFPEEFKRPENAGDFIVNTIDFLRPFANRFVSLSDLIALGAVFALEQCGGPHVNYRAGRVDAKIPAPPGLPVPPDALKTLSAKFSRAGFSQQDMREMVACGHTIGGVDPRTFPDIIHHGREVVPFDSTEDVFDNNMMKEYIAGRSTNPLVVTPNITDRSDLRIFASDGNATIKAMADSVAVLHKKCSSIIARMIDAVPDSVQLTDVITPMLVKPEGIKLLRNSDNSLSLFGRVRFWGLDAAGIDKRTVKLVWADADGYSSAGYSYTLTNTSIGETMAPAHSNLWYEFPTNGVSIQASKSISKFWFEVTENGHTAIHDQHGQGFPLQTKALLSGDSCVSKSGDVTHVKITVPKSLYPTYVFVESDSRANNGDVSKATHPAILDKALSAKNSYFDTYSASLTGMKQVGNGTFNVGAIIYGKEIADWSFFDNSDSAILSSGC